MAVELFLILGISGLTVLIKSSQKQQLDSRAYFNYLIYTQFLPESEGEQRLKYFIFGFVPISSISGHSTASPKHASLRSIAYLEIIKFSKCNQSIYPRKYIQHA